LNKLQQKQSQLILDPQYVLSKAKKKPRKIPLEERFEKDPSTSHSFTYSFLFSREKGKIFNL